MKKLLTAVFAVVFSASTLALAELPHQKGGGHDGPRPLASRKNSASSPLAPKPGQKGYRGTLSHVKGSRPIPHKHQTASNQQ